MVAASYVSVGRGASAEGNTSHISTTSTDFLGQRKSIMTIGPLPNAMKPGFHGVRTHWIWGFMTFELARRTRSVMLMMPVLAESGIPGRTPSPTRPASVQR
jgi:hypothetical protein